MYEIKPKLGLVDPLVLLSWLPKCNCVVSKKNLSLYGDEILKAVTNLVSGARLEDPVVFAGVNCRRIAGPRLQSGRISANMAASP